MVLPAWLGMQAEPFKYLCISLLCLTGDVFTRQALAYSPPAQGA